VQFQGARDATDPEKRSEARLPYFQSGGQCGALLRRPAKAEMPKYGGILDETT
jgi:hypothetical protein